MVKEMLLKDIQKLMTLTEKADPRDFYLLRFPGIAKVWLNNRGSNGMSYAFWKALTSLVRRDYLVVSTVDVFSVAVFGRYLFSLSPGECLIAEEISMNLSYILPEPSLLELESLFSDLIDLEILTQKKMVSSIIKNRKIKNSARAELLRYFRIVAHSPAKKVDAFLAEKMQDKNELIIEVASYAFRMRKGWLAAQDRKIQKILE